MRTFCLQSSNRIRQAFCSARSSISRRIWTANSTSSDIVIRAICSSLIIIARDELVFFRSKQFSDNVVNHLLIPETRIIISLDLVEAFTHHPHRLPCLPPGYKCLPLLQDNQSAPPVFPLSLSDNPAPVSAVPLMLF